MQVTGQATADGGYSNHTNAAQEIASVGGVYSRSLCLIFRHIETRQPPEPADWFENAGNRRNAPGCAQLPALCNGAVFQ